MYSVTAAPNRRPCSSALVRKCGDVEVGIARPRSQNPVIEIEAVHLRPDDLVIDLLRHRPFPRVQRSKPRLKIPKLAVLARHRRRRVIGDAVHDPRLLERAPLREERDEIRRTGSQDDGKKGAPHGCALYTLPWCGLLGGLLQATEGSVRGNWRMR